MKGHVTSTDKTTNRPRGMRNENGCQKAMMCLPYAAIIPAEYLVLSLFLLYPTDHIIRCRSDSYRTQHISYQKEYKTTIPWISRQYREYCSELHSNLLLRYLKWHYVVPSLYVNYLCPASRPVTTQRCHDVARKAGKTMSDQREAANR